MKLEAVGRVAVGNLGFEIRRQVYNADGAERTFFRADTATNAKTFGDECNLGVGGDLDAETTTAYNRAGFFAFLATFLRVRTLASLQ